MFDRLTGLAMTLGLARPKASERVNLVPIQFGVIGLAFAILYAPTFWALALVWWSRPEYSHGFLIPIIALYLLWVRRRRFLDVGSDPDVALGIPLMMAAGVLVVAGRVGGVALAEDVSLLLMIAGLVLAMYGRRIFKLALLPIAYLVFMLPITEEVVGPLQGPLRLMTAEMAVAILQALGYPVFLEHYFIALPRLTLEVADVCSGANFLISIVAIGIPLASTMLTRRVNRLVLLVSAIVIGVVSNWLRVVVIALWALYGGEVVHGPFHVFQGLLVFQAGLAYLFLATWGLSQLPSERAARRAAQSGGVPQASVRHGPNPSVTRRRWAAAGVLIGLLWYATSVPAGAVPLRQDFKTFPQVLGTWIGSRQDPRSAPLRVPGADREILIAYRARDNRTVTAYVAYFGVQHQGKELGRLPANALSAGATERSLSTADGTPLVVNDVRLAGASTSGRIVYWYDIDGRRFADYNAARLAIVANGLLRGRNNGALVAVYSEEGSTSLGNSDGLDAAAHLADFVGAFAPVLREYLP